MKRKSRKSYAYTKRYPIPNHPAEYRKNGKKEEIEYVTFTHSSEVDLDKGDKSKPLETHRKISTIELSHNIDKNKTEKSYVVPIVYQGERDLLGRKRDDLKVRGDADKKKVDDIFKFGIRIRVRDEK